MALRVAKESLPAYAHANSPKTYTQHQLFACLVLKRFFKTDYRGIWQILRDCSDLRRWLGLPPGKVPHWTTIHHAHQRLLAATPTRNLLEQTVDYGLGKRRTIKQAAGDSTGLRSDRESRHYTRRRHRIAHKPGPHGKKRFPKASLLVDCRSHLVLALRAGRGPRPDVDELADLLAELPKRVSLHHLLLDAGYYRRLMARTMHHRDYYGQRWQVETANSMIKRNQGDVALGHTAWSRRREVRLATLTHNIAIVLVSEVLYGAQRNDFTDAA